MSVTTEDFVDPFEVDEDPFVLKEESPIYVNPEAIFGLVDIPGYDPEQGSWEPPDPTSEAAEETAEWVLRKVLEARTEQRLIKEGYKPRLNRAQAREKATLYHLGSWLEAYAKARLGRSTKSVLLPNGVMGFRKQQEKIEVLDEEEAIKWASTTAFEGEPRKLAGLCVVMRWQIIGSLLNSMLGSTLVGSSTLELTLTLVDANWVVSRVPDYERENLIPGGIKFDAKAALAYYQATGDVPGGCRYIPERDEFYVSEPRKGKE